MNKSSKHINIQYNKAKQQQNKDTVRELILTELMQ